MMEPPAPICAKCRLPIPRELFNAEALSKCEGCGSWLRVEAYPNLGKQPARGTAGELSVDGGEARCFYHESKKAAEVCEVCGRFLCALCDCVLHGKHYCPGCLETGRGSGRIKELDFSRTLYGRQAFFLSLLPFYFTGIIAVFIALRYWKTPLSIVQPRRWMLPTALVLGSIQTLGFTALIVMAMMR